MPPLRRVDRCRRFHAYFVETRSVHRQGAPLMATHRVRIVAIAFRSARALAESGADGMTTWSDVVEKGLRQRVRGRSAAWSLSWGDVTRSLGTLDEVKTVKAAWEMAAAVRALLKSGDDPTNYIAARHAGRAHQEGIDAALRRKTIADGAWKWSELVEHYLTDHIAAERFESP